MTPALAMVRAPPRARRGERIVDLRKESIAICSTACALLMRRVPPELEAPECGLITRFGRSALDARIHCEFRCILPPSAEPAKGGRPAAGRRAARGWCERRRGDHSSAVFAR